MYLHCRSADIRDLDDYRFCIRDGFAYDKPHRGYRVLRPGRYSAGPFFASWPADVDQNAERQSSEGEDEQSDASIIPIGGDIPS